LVDSCLNFGLVRSALAVSPEFEGSQGGGEGNQAKRESQPK